MNMEQIKIIKNRIKEIEVTTEQLLIEKELLRKQIISENNFFSNAEMLKEKFNKFIENQSDIPKEYVDIINKEFWSMIRKTKYFVANVHITMKVAAILILLNGMCARQQPI